MSVKVSKKELEKPKKLQYDKDKEFLISKMKLQEQKFYTHTPIVAPKIVGKHVPSLKITSDGTPYGTKITLADGTPVNGCKEVTFTMSAVNGMTAVLFFEDVELDLTLPTNSYEAKNATS